MEAFLRRVIRPGSALRSRIRVSALQCPQHRGVSTQGDVTGPDSRAIDFAFAFDIDGVLMHGPRPLAHATETLQYLGANRIPFILLTNGGGRLERDRAADLTAKLGVDIPQDAIQQSHTPWKNLPSALRENKTVLATGVDAGRARHVLESYGFKHVVIPADIVHAQPSIFPFDPLLKHVYAEQHRPLPKPIWTPDLPPDVEPLRIEAIFILNDPRDWALDTQVITDILASDNGVLGKHAPPSVAKSVMKPGAKPQSKTELTPEKETPKKETPGKETGPQSPDPRPLPGLRRIPVYFSNSDIVWATSHASPRLGTGAFNTALKAVWSHVSPPGLNPTISGRETGKPRASAYLHAQLMLLERQAKLLSSSGSAAEAEAKVGVGSSISANLKRVYMVGDNPDSDIVGAKTWRRNPKNAERVDWKSVLVKTGVWREGSGRPSRDPDKIADDVRGAVEWALEQEGIEAKIK